MSFENSSPEIMTIDRLSCKSTEVARLLKALANPKRLKLLCVLARQERRAGELADEIGCSQSGTSQHLSYLKKECLVKTRSDGQCVYYSVTEATRKLLYDLLDVASDRARWPRTDQNAPRSNSHSGN